MIECLRNNSDWVTILSILYAADQVLEYWLGKTDRTKFGSKAELIISLFRAAVAVIKKPKEG